MWQANKNKMINEIVDILLENKILGFLVDEVAYSLYYMNPYKVKNVYEQLDNLINSLREIQNNYITSVRI